MTAEVAILNKQGVAMAADSAVTIGGSKIFNTVNKLFALTKHEPVGIMVYSSASIMGVPIETVIKSFRRELDHKSFDSLEGYSGWFDSFLREDKTIFAEGDRVRSLEAYVDVVLEAIFEKSYEALSDISKKKGWGHPSKLEAIGAVRKVALEMGAFIKTLSEITIGNTSEIRGNVSEAIETHLSSKITKFKEQIPFDSASENKIKQIVRDSFFVKQGFGGDTGIVVAGFGCKDTFPALRSSRFHCSALGLHKIIETTAVDITHKKTASIAPFAQADVMSTFVEGIDRTYPQYLKNYIQGYFKERYKIITKSHPENNDLAEEVKTIGKELEVGIESEINSLGRDHFVNPLMGIVSSMPKEELALLAESFVNLTALKRKASSDAETVGGPTDVAVISKGDGFIWIKRKHYFDTKYNPTFIQSK